MATYGHVVQHSEGGGRSGAHPESTGVEPVIDTGSMRFPLPAHRRRGNDLGAHAHEHGLSGGWSVWLSHRLLRGVLVALVLTAAATLIGVVLLWPDNSGRRAAIARADTIGLTSERFAARVDRVSDGPCSYSTPNRLQYCRTVTVVPNAGPDAGTVIDLGEFNLIQAAAAPSVQVGDRLVVGYEPSTSTYFYADRDRRRMLVVLGAVFAAVVIAFGRRRGLAALTGMALTVTVLVAFVAPAVLDGHDPALVAVVAAAAISFISLYLSHGITPTTTVALAGTICALALTLGITSLFFAAAQFSGLASEEALALPTVVAGLDLPALVLGGAILGALGALDDVTVTQVAAVAELHDSNPDLGIGQLLAAGIRVGREHIASTVNTLLLAYAGASMPILLLFAVSNQSLGMIANAEIVAVEIARTLCGSIGLVAAVPITTALAAILLGTAPSPVRPVGTANGPPDPDPPTTAHDDRPVRRRPTWDDFGPRHEPQF